MTPKNCSVTVQVAMDTAMDHRSSPGTCTQFNTMTAFAMEAALANNPVPISRHTSILSRIGRFSFHRKVTGLKDKQRSVTRLIADPVVDMMRTVSASVH